MRIALRVALLPLLVGCKEKPPPEPAAVVAPVASAAVAAPVPAPASVTPPEAPAPSATVSPETAAAGAHLVQTLTELATLHESNETDCVKLTKVLTAFHERRGAELAKAPPSVYAAIEADPGLTQGLAAAMQKITHATEKCAANAEFEKFRESLRTEE